MRIGFFIEQLRQSDWKHFFAKNGLGEIKWKKVSQWREQHDDTACVLTVSGGIAGGYRGPRCEGLFAAWQTDDTGDLEIREILQKQAESHFHSYAIPICRCRVGYHWKCGIHGNWRG